MPISVKALHPLFGAEVSGLDLRASVDAETLRSIVRALDRYAVLVFRDQPLTDTQQISFSGRFGSLETPVGSLLKARRTRLGDRLLADVSNLDARNKIRSRKDPWRLFQQANQLWHTDGSFKPVPSRISFLSAREVPPIGGETEFADLRAAYDELGAAMRARIGGLAAEHCIAHSRGIVGYKDFSEAERAALPPVAQPLVRLHRGSGRKSLYLGAHASYIIGLPISEGRALLRSLTDFATQPRFVLRHCWRLSDLVVWDNRCTLHRGRPYDDLRHRRDLRRSSVEDTDLGTVVGHR